MKIPIVTEQDELIEYIDADNRIEGSITRITSLWVINEKGEVLLAQRAFTKRKDPGLWGPAVAGSVEEGETYESNIVKEAEEEIGLIGVEIKHWKKLRRKTTHDYFVQIFTAFVKSDYPFMKQDKEVEAIKWFSKEELLQKIDKNPEIFLSSMPERVVDFFEYSANINK